LDTPTPKPQIPAERWPQASAASLPWLSIATILMALVAIGYVVQLLT
jgi:hypothetical protein